jgi:hypothetical protein
MFHDLTKSEKRALREAAALAHERDREMSREDRDVVYLQARNDDLPLVVGGAVAKGILQLEDIGEAGRAIAEDIAERLAAVAASPTRSEPPAKEYDESAPVSVSAIVTELDFVHEETVLYLNRRTGEVEVMDEELMPDEDELDDELGDYDADGEDEDSEAGTRSTQAEEQRDTPEWRVKADARACAIASDPDWLRFLTPSDLDDRDARVRFARRAGPAASQELFDALHGRGGGRRFREVLHRRGMEQQWEAFRAARLAETVEWQLEQLGIKFRK